MASKIKHKANEHTWTIAFHTVVRGVRTTTREHCHGCDKFRDVPYDRPEAKSGPTILGVTSVTGTEKWGSNGGHNE